jgi:relaxase-like protein
VVARINTGKSISKALNYNEKKVQFGEAEILHARNFLKDAHDMNFYDKIKSFEKLTSLNEKTETNTLHVSLNFDPSEKIDNDKMIAIAENYMKQIGFGDQPYLVYRHYDTGHPHIHIVSTNIKNDGSRISMHNMGRNQSEVARKQIEKDFDLVKAESKKQTDDLKFSPVNAEKINSGKRSTKAAISNVLAAVINQYKYASLPELNAILKQYNVRADRCGEGSETYKHNGLLFNVLDKNGNKIGTPIKASRFYMKPTLKNLEKKFEVNEKLKEPYTKSLRGAIDSSLLKYPHHGLEQLINDLKSKGINTVLRQNKDGIIYGITFVDNNTKCVFNGSDLGKGYSAKAILEKTKLPVLKTTPPLADEKKDSMPLEISLHGSSAAYLKHSEKKLLEIITDTSMNHESIPYALKKKKRKRKKRNIKI